MRYLNSSLIAVVLAIMSCLWVNSAYAACSEKRVKSLAKQGKTVSYIARTCSIAKDEVKEILAGDEDEDEEKGEAPQGESNGLPSGAPLSYCGCWGPVQLGHRQQAPACKSGIAKPRACGQVCPSGGLAWQGVCT